jgi:hypothetical protein
VRRALARAIRSPAASLGYADILDQPSINVSPGGQLDQLLRRQAALLGRLPSHRMQVSSIDAAARLVVAGLGSRILAARGGGAACRCRRLALVPARRALGRPAFRDRHATRPPLAVGAARGCLAESLQRMAG